ncbi:MAG: DMT family transporter [Candidatus Moranbacteria bacterium]|nr:DMT family transporter [Candidatus Moranbacteria bacterium]
MKKYLFLFLVTVSEATIGVFVKLTGGNVPIFTLNFYRVFFAFLFLLAVVPFLDRGFLKTFKSNIRDILIVGALIALQISMFNIAMSLAPIANVVIFWSIAPFFVFIFSAIFLKEKVRKEHIFIFLIALTGIFIAKPLDGGNALGNVIALIDGAVYAGLVTYLRSENKTESPAQVLWFMMAATVFLLPAVFVSGLGDLAKMIDYPALGLSLPVVLWVVCLGVVSTGVAYLFITLSLRKIKASVYSLVDIIVSPIIAAFLGFLVFTEVPSENMIYGGFLLLLSGFWLTNFMTEGRPGWYSSLMDKIKNWNREDHPNPMIRNKNVK